MPTHEEKKTSFKRHKLSEARGGLWAHTVNFVYATDYYIADSHFICYLLLEDCVPDAKKKLVFFLILTTFAQNIIIT